MQIKNILKLQFVYSLIKLVIYELRPRLTRYNKGTLELNDDMDIMVQHTRMENKVLNVSINN